MEKFRELIEKSKKKLQLADYIATMTYPAVKDPHLLLSAVENLFLAYSYAMNSILQYDLLFKRISPFEDQFESKFNTFQKHSAKRYGIDEGHLKIMKDLRGMLVAHKKSPVEFSRDGNFVICDEDYKMRTISQKEAKNYVEKAKLFITHASTIVSRDLQVS